MNPPASDQPLPAGAERVELANGAREVVVREEPLFLDIEGTRLLTMRTPMGEAADTDWALGFLASEGVIASMSEIRSIEFTSAATITGARAASDTLQGVAEEARPADEVRVRLWRGQPPGRMGLARTHEMRASCGLCGVATAGELLKGLAPLPPGEPAIAAARIGELIRLLRRNQPLFAATGGCHGAALATVEGGLLAVAEDIGRHNALDRVIGACLRQGIHLDRAVALLSGRAGYEMVIKCLRAGTPVILSVGAASTFAVELARTAGATLTGFIRVPGEPGADDAAHMHVYCDRGRIHGS